MDLSWPHGAAVNDGIPSNSYIDSTVGRADALSRMHLGRKYLDLVNNDTALQRAQRVRVPQGTFSLTFDP